MPKAWSIFCDCPELAVDVSRDAERIDVCIVPVVHDDPCAAAAESVRRGDLAAVAVEGEVEPDALVELSAEARAHKAKVPLALISSHELGLAHDLGLPAVHDTGALMAVAALLSSSTERPWAAATQGLPSVDRARLGDSVEPRKEGRFERVDHGLIAHVGGDEARPLGTARDVAAALTALRASHDASRPKVPVVKGVEEEAVLEVILGPARALSDPASKAALAPYDVPLPLEELCATPSRAASEAARIGFPVRMGLASPDLRLWDHPDLIVDEVHSAAQARDVFRQLTALARHRSKEARLLGVTVGAATVAHALLQVRLTPLTSGPVLAEIGFADPHGRAASDTTTTVLPATPAALERVLQRLEGSGLLLDANSKQRDLAVRAIGDVLMRLAAFCHQWRTQIETVEVNPLAVLLSGELELRQARITVGDAFSRSLQKLA